MPMLTSSFVTSFATSFATSFGTRRGLLVGAVLGSLFVTTLPVITGCAGFVVAVEVGMSLCNDLMTQISAAGISAPPTGYQLCKEDDLELANKRYKLCVYCNGEPDDVRYVQLNCEGSLYPAVVRESPMMLDTADGSGAGLNKISCDERVKAFAYSNASTTETHLDASIVLPDRRTLPDRSAYAGLTILADGQDVPTEGEFELDVGTELRITGPFDLAAHYAALLGVRTLDYKADGAKWHVEIDPNYAVMTILRNHEVHDTRFLFAPPH